jgi:murein L,D-transpeptidase YcbB/YkuD
VKQYQYYNGLGMTGKTDSAFLAVLNRPYAEKAAQVRYNLERSRWLTKEFRYPYVLVNVPQYRLYYYDSTAAMNYTMRVVVGKTSRQTPQLDASISNVVFNPNWTVPPTILKKDILPGVSSSGAAYLSRKGLKVYNMDGKPVDAATVTSDNYRRFIYRQDPGAGNALGSVKINMPNKWLIYMHDTPHRSDFQNRNRAQSSGCVRLHHPREFAAMLLNQPKYNEEEIDSVILKRKTVAVKPPQSIGVHIVYFTVFPDSAGNLCFVSDVYKRDNKFRKTR